MRGTSRRSECSRATVASNDKSIRSASSGARARPPSPAAICCLVTALECRGPVTRVHGGPCPGTVPRTSHQRWQRGGSCAPLGRDTASISPRLAGVGGRTPCFADRRTPCSSTDASGPPLGPGLSRSWLACSPVSGARRSGGDHLVIAATYRRVPDCPPKLRVVRVEPKPRFTDPEVFTRPFPPSVVPGSPQYGQLAFGAQLVGRSNGCITPHRTDERHGLRGS